MKDYPQNVTLISGYHTRLTQAERNQFAEYLRDLPQLERLADERAVYASAVYTGQTDLAKAATSAILIIENELFSIAKEWCEILEETRTELGHNET